MNDNTEQLLKELTSNLDSLGRELKQELGGIKEKVNEIDKKLERLEEKIIGIDTRFKNEETISRTAFGAIVGGVVLAAIKYL